MRSLIIDNFKNILGWKTNRKLIAFAVDDYGNVRIDSKRAFMNINQGNSIKELRFDRFDTLETREDLEELYTVLSSVKDIQCKSAVFTPYALPCNIDFELMRDEGFITYRNELLPVTYSKLSKLQPTAYEGAWQLWNEGIDKALMRPEFHGREHFNLKVFEEKLAKKDPDLILALENRSLANIGYSGYSSIGWTASFSFWDPVKDTSYFPEVIKEGLDFFEQVYGYKSVAFTPPAQQVPSDLESELRYFGLEALDKPFFQKKHVGFDKYKMEFCTMGYKVKKGLVELVRNVVFEPTSSSIDHVSKALAQIEAAFTWNKPAIISSHRVNFCGHIDPKNREKGLGDLKSLLGAIVKKWPDVEFVSVRDLVQLIKNDQ
jgi:hypothetical protein